MSEQNKTKKLVSDHQTQEPVEKREKMKREKMNGKAIRWARGHTDKYVFYKKVWVLVECSLDTSLKCTAPSPLTSAQMSAYKAYNCRVDEAAADLLLDLE